MDVYILDTGSRNIVFDYPYFKSVHCSFQYNYLNYIVIDWKLQIGCMTANCQDCHGCDPHYFSTVVDFPGNTSYTWFNNSIREVYYWFNF